jgi:hypothetical protein
VGKNDIMKRNLALNDVSRLAVVAALLCVAASQTGCNPFCQDVTMTFSDKGSYYGATKTIANVIPNDKKLESITITDSTSLFISYIKLSAPADSSGSNCPFYYPSYQGYISYTGNDFKKSTSSGSTTYTAENTTQTRTSSGSGSYTTAYCPPEGHLGNWTLEIRYPDPLGVSTTATYPKTFKICFTFK